MAGSLVQFAGVSALAILSLRLIESAIANTSSATATVTTPPKTEGCGSQLQKAVGKRSFEIKLLNITPEIVDEYLRFRLQSQIPPSVVSNRPSAWLKKNKKIQISDEGFWKQALQFGSLPELVDRLQIKENLGVPWKRLQIARVLSDLKNKDGLTLSYTTFLENPPSIARRAAEQGLKETGPEIYSSAKGLFGSWEEALLASGVAPLTKMKWNDELVSAYFNFREQMAQTGKPADEAKLSLWAKNNYRQEASEEDLILYLRGNGSFENAIRKAGLDPNTVAFRWQWPLSRQIFFVQGIVREFNIPLEPQLLRNDPGGKIRRWMREQSIERDLETLINQAKEKFGGFDQIYSLAGVEKPALPALTWDKESLRRYLRFRDAAKRLGFPEQMRYVNWWSKYVERKTTSEKDLANFLNNQGSLNRLFEELELDVNNPEWKNWPFFQYAEALRVLAKGGFLGTSRRAIDLAAANKYLKANGFPIHVLSIFTNGGKMYGSALALRRAAGLELKEGEKLTEREEKDLWEAVQKTQPGTYRNEFLDTLLLHHEQTGFETLDEVQVRDLWIRFHHAKDQKKFQRFHHFLFERYRYRVPEVLGREGAKYLKRGNYNLLLTDAYLGLYQAIGTFDPERNDSFANFTPKRIIGSIQDGFRKDSRLERGMAEEGRHIEAAVSVLTIRLERPPTQKEIRAYLAMSKKDFAHYWESYVEVKKAARDFSSFSSEDGLELDPVDDADTTVLDLLGKNEFWEFVVKGMPKLHRRFTFLYFRDGQKITAVMKTLKLSLATVRLLEKEVNGMIAQRKGEFQDYLFDK